MTIIVGRRGILGDLQGEVLRLGSLLVDLARIADDWRPSAEELASAPLIDDFVTTVRHQECLTGQVFGHPLLGSRTIVTSELWVLAPELGWARTYSRFYRLGVPLGMRRDG